jgi:hypothetical protein
LNMRIVRRMKREDGIFSEFMADVPASLPSSRRFETVERAFPDGSGGWAPVLKPGTYACRRGLHRLHPNAAPFETFEIIGVTGHTGVLFHPGNYGGDSLACVCVGDQLAYDPVKHAEMVTRSQKSFADFMALQEGVEMFLLTVVA